MRTTAIQSVGSPKGAPGWSLTAEEIAKLDAVSQETPVYPYWHQKDFDRNPKPTTW